MHLTVQMLAVNQYLWTPSNFCELNHSLNGIVYLTSGLQENMEDDTENISSILRGVQLPDDSYNINMFQQSVDSMSERQPPETGFVLKNASEITQALSLSHSMNRPPPSETSYSTQLTHQEPVVPHDGWNLGIHRSSELNLRFSEQQSTGNLAGIYPCNSNATTQTSLAHWSPSFQGFANLGQNDSQLDVLLGCLPAYKPVISDSPETLLHASRFDLTHPVISTSTSFEVPVSLQESAAYPTLSPPTAIKSAALLPSHSEVKPSNNPSAPVNDQGQPDAKEGLDEESDSDGPYAKLIHKALMHAPGHKMHLQDIYAWFEKNTRKAKANDTKKGWRNSIRHNLSMNAAFQGTKTSSEGGQSKKNNVWALTEEAIRNGVQSTTRYRKQGSKKTKSEHPVPQRQRSGAKGGRAAKRSARVRRAARDLTPKTEPDLPTVSITTSLPQSERHTHYMTTTVEHPQPLSLATPRLGITALDEYDFRRIIQCTDVSPDFPLFYYDDSNDKNGGSLDCHTSTDQAFWAKS
ncbi:hypothetical protein VTO42DRAFT_6895 [Malbranchea cinnamomea]